MTQAREELLTRAELLHLLFAAPYETLRARADAARAAYVGDTVRLRGLVEFSNHCLRNCRYCGLRRENRNLRRYRLSRSRILEAAALAVASGADSIVLQSGEWRENPRWLAGVIREIKARWPVAVTLGVGEQPESSYALWKEAGADRFLLKHETADPRLYADLHPGHSLDERIAALRVLRKLGYEVGSGFIVGLPGQRPETLADDILLVRELGVSMCGAGPFLPQADTPLGHEAHGSVELALRVMAVLRIALPHANLPATTALATLDPVAGQREGLRAGGNVLMPGFTPPELRQEYRLYDNKRRVGMEEARRAIAEAGRVCAPRLY